jgi:hypothetical protein
MCYSLAVGVVAGDGIVTGYAAETGMGGVLKAYRIDIIAFADLFLIFMAFDTCRIFAQAVTV